MIRYSIEKNNQPQTRILQKISILRRPFGFLPAKDDIPLPEEIFFFFQNI